MKHARGTRTSRSSRRQTGTRSEPLGAAAATRTGTPARSGADAAPVRTVWRHSPLWPALLSGLLFWAALPPLGWWPLGWLAPIGLLWIVAAPDSWSVRHPYVAIWGASAVFWIAVMQGIRLAHWANYFGLLALGAYLGIFWPLFVAIARRAVHQWHVPLFVAAPVVWTGIEVARAYGPLGFSMALLGHTQVTQLLLIQISDLFGAYAVSFVLMFVAACFYSMLPLAGHRWRIWPLVPIIGLVGVVLLYGHVRLGQQPPGARHSALRVALIQGAIDTEFDDDPRGPQRMLDQYSQLTEQALRKFPSLDLVVWPESMFPVTDLIIEPDTTIELDPEFSREDIQMEQAAFARLTRNVCQQLNTPRGAGGPRSKGRGTSWLLGTTTWQFGAHAPYRYNAALLLDANARVVTRYYKMHPVMFGEYVPFGDFFPWLYRLMPMPNGLTPGRHARTMSVDGMRLSPSICFENTIPQLIRGHVVALTRAGQPPDVLVNLTNDGWFWGSSILDMQLDCAVFRAVELRRPMLIAANTGLSAWIDGNGRLRAKGPRRACATLLAEVRPDRRLSLYQRWGDLPVGVCAVFCLFVVLAWFRACIGSRRHRPS